MNQWTDLDEILPVEFKTLFEATFWNEFFLDAEFTKTNIKGTIKEGLNVFDVDFNTFVTKNLVNDIVTALTHVVVSVILSYIYNEI